MMSTETAQIAPEAPVPSRAVGNSKESDASASDRGRMRDESVARALLNIEYPGLRSILVKLKEKVTWALVDHASHAASDAERQQITADLLAFNRRADHFEDELIERLFAPSLPSPPASTSCEDPAASPKELSLLDEEAFERSLETRKLAAHLSDRFNLQLTELESLLRANGRRTPAASVEDLPVAAARIAEALGQLADSMDMGLSSRRVLFSSAKDTFDRELGVIYENLLAAVRSQTGIAGRARSNSGRQRLEEAAKTARRSSEAGRHGTGTEAPRDREPRGIAGSPPDLRLSTDGSPPPAALWPKLPAVGDTPPAIVEGLDRVAKAHGFQKGLERDHRQRARLAAQLWDAVRKGVTPSSETDAWWHQLQVPLLTTATTDPEFFVRPDHPVRILLDRLDELGSLVGQDADAGLTRSVRDTVEHLLTQLNATTAFDRVLLDHLAGQIEEVAENQSRSYQRNVERVVKTCAGRDHLRHCREGVQAELDRRYAGKQVPPTFGEVLSSGWRTLLEISLLKQGEEGAEYRSHWETLDALVQRLGGEAHTVTSRLPEADVLLGRLAAGLEFAAVDPLQRAALLERLGRLFAEAERGFPKLVPYRSLARNPEASPPPEGTSAEEWSSALGRARDLKVGDAVLLRGASDRRQQLKTAWVGEGGWLYTLVDERGLKAADLTPVQLATKLLSGQVAVERAERRPLTERAIDQMLDAFRQQVERQAASDPLTGLSNPSRFQAHLARALTDVGSGTSHCLLWIDVDQFTVIRNTFGLEAADQLRAAIARLLKQHLAGKGTLAFLGGDQFAATLTRCGKDHGIDLADEFRRAVSDLSFSWEETSISTAVSIGVIDLTEINTSCADVLKAADATVFAAKREGGNRCLLYNGDDGVIYRRKSSMDWLRRVDQALDRGHLDLRCQRIAPVDPDSGLKPHYELLLGVRDADEQSLDISQFISAAETYNRMWAVDRWVARTAFQWAAEHGAVLEGVGGIAINLSGQSMNDEGIVDFIRNLFADTGVSPEWISFEATETVAITHLGRASHIVRAIKSMGCAFALDDFGSGFSSYSYLKQLPVDWLKIDGSFVRGIHRDPTDYGVVKSIHEIAHFMGKKTIAEYVEDDAILLKLREIGVDYAQGYRIEKPCRLGELV